MILTKEELLELMSNPASEDYIKAGGDLQDEHRIHVNGDGYEEYITQIIGHENAEEFTTRQELTEPATMILTQRIMDEQSRWENVQGVKKYYEWKDNKQKDKEFRKILDICWKGETIEYFIHEFVKNAIYTEFNGFVFVEQERIVKDNKIFKYLRDKIVTLVSETRVKPKPYIVFKPLSAVHDFKSRGNKVEYVIFEYGEIRDKKTEKITKLYRAIDDRWDRIIEYVDGKYKFSERKQFPAIKNKLGYVPAVQLSIRKDNVLVDEIKTSPIRQTIPLLKTFLTQWSEHVISCIKHAHPIYWQLGQKCRHTDEQGNACEEGTIYFTDKEGKEGQRQCENCKGEGAILKKDASTALILPQIDSEGQPFNVTNAAGYVTPPVEILVHQMNELDWLQEQILFSGTGVKNLPETKIEKTATEAILNFKPLQDIIGNILDNIEYVEVFVTNCMGKLYFGDQYQRCQITYPRNLNLREEKLVLEEIEQAKRSGASTFIVKELHVELIHARYQSSKIDLERNLILAELEPLIGYTLAEIDKEYIPYDKKVMKYNFVDYINRFELEEGLIVDYREERPIDKRIEGIAKLLVKYNEESLKEIRVSQVADANTQSVSDES